MKGFISIVIPTFNEEKYLEPTLRSIGNQLYDGRFEVIVSDGGSEDGTLDIAEKYVDQIIRVEKRGIGVGRNAGAKRARGDVLLFVDADTILQYNTITEVGKVFRDDEIIGGAVPLLPFSSKVRDIVLFFGFNEFVRRNLELGKGRARIAGACCAYRKSVFDEIGGFNEELETLEDFDLSERISKIGKIKYIDETMALVSTRRIANWGRIKSVERYLSLYVKYLLSDKGFKRYSTKMQDYQPIR